MNMFPMLSKFGKPLLVLDNFKFREFRQAKGGKQWKCSNGKCTVSFVTNLEGTVIIQQPSGTHNHDPDKNLHRQYIANQAKQLQRTENSGDCKPAKLLHQIISTAPAKVAKNILRDDLVNARRSIYRKKKILLNSTQLPESKEEIRDASEMLKIELAETADEGDPLLPSEDIFRAEMDFGYACEKLLHPTVHRKPNAVRRYSI